MDVYKLSKRLNRITRLQVTSPRVEDKENDLPLSQEIQFVESEPLQVYLNIFPGFCFDNLILIYTYSIIYNAKIQNVYSRLVFMHREDYISLITMHTSMTL